MSENFDEIYRRILETDLDSLRRNFSFIDFCERHSRPIVIYGAGKNGSAVFDICKLCGIEVAAFCDKFKIGVYGDTCIPIISPFLLEDKYKDAIVIITVVNDDEQIRCELAKLKFAEQRIISVPAVCNYLVNRQFFEQIYFEGYHWAYNFFKDKISRKIILNRIRFHLFGDLLLKTSDKPEYFDLPLSKQEVFVQAGCYDGGTVEEFLSIGGGEVYSFEADPKSYKISKSNLMEYENVKLIPLGLWSSETTLCFSVNDGGGSSFVIGNANTLSIEVTSLDLFFAHEPVVPTFIQLDVEGSELEALKGAENMIRKHKPKLAICVYHKPQDIYEIPQLLHEYNSNYKFYLQQCSDGLWDTVLYAI